MESKDKHLTEAHGLYAEFLKKNKMFFTKERTQLLDFIVDQKGHFSADELLFEMQKRWQHRLPGRACSPARLARVPRYGSSTPAKARKSK